MVQTDPQIFTYTRQSDLDPDQQEREMLRATEMYSEWEEQGKSLFRKYHAAIREMRTRFDILDDDLELRMNRNPIHNIEWRLKKPQSAFDKLKRYGKMVSLDSLQENILDMAGIRVICSYVDDVYRLADMLRTQDDLEFVKVKDYIAHPKPNGYRSLHITLKVPVYFMDEKDMVPVEVQFRTIAMDFWASLEHQLKYKGGRNYADVDMFAELKECADIIEEVDQRMQHLMHLSEQADEKDGQIAGRLAQHVSDAPYLHKVNP
ncbi:MAG: GTP pyrophosphokinase [Eggerthellaceae bacterium]|jgi:putative GTP pyrophosphokinase